MNKTIPILFLLVLFIASCSNDEINVIQEEDELSFELGHSFRKVPHTYDSIVNNVQYVNQTNAVKAVADTTSYIGEHWVYKSPSLDNAEIGFSVLYPENSSDITYEVVLFLHASNGTENNGAGLFFDSFINQFDGDTTNKKILIFPNGIYAPMTGSSSVWRKRSIDGHNFNHSQQLIELISGIIESETLFPFAKKSMNDWSVTGFSAGGDITMGLYLDPVFIQNHKYQPRNIMAQGLWASSQTPFYDLEEGLALLKACDTDIELTITNHVFDDVDCAGYKQYQVRDSLLNKLRDVNSRYTYLGLKDIVTAPCVNDKNPAHSVKFYLRNNVVNAFKEVSCRDTSYLNAYPLLGDILFK